MMAGINDSYAGVLYVGYHAPGGSNGSPLAHSFSHSKLNWIKINGKLASEFTANTLYAAEKGVAPIFISGDKYICDMAKEEVPQITTVAVKDCRGNSTFNLHPLDACDLIKEGVKKALETQVPLPVLPDELVLDVCVTTHQQVRSALAHPEVKQLDEYTVRYIAHTPTELNLMRSYIMG
jgi:D-amino peptidase